MTPSRLGKGFSQAKELPKRKKGKEEGGRRKRREGRRKNRTERKGTERESKRPVSSGVLRVGRDLSETPL